MLEYVITWLGMVSMVRGCIRWVLKWDFGDSGMPVSLSNYNPHLVRSVVMRILAILKISYLKFHKLKWEAVGWVGKLTQRDIK